MEKNWSYEQIKKEALYKFEHMWDDYIEATHDMVMRDIQRRRKAKKS